MASYSYITLGQMRAELLNRLQDSGAVYTQAAEANLYIQEGLRILNAQTAAFPEDYQFDFNPGDAWKTLNVAGSPRQRTVTDSDLYAQMAKLGFARVQETDTEIHVEAKNLTTYQKRYLKQRSEDTGLKVILNSQQFLDSKDPRAATIVEKLLA